MSYRSDIHLKTTKEGYEKFVEFDKTITEPHNKALDSFDIKITPKGFYKLTAEYLKWYDDYPSVNNFMKVLRQLEIDDIPYKFIRIGEATSDIEEAEYIPDYADSTMDDILNFGVTREVYDPEGCETASTSEQSSSVQDDEIDMIDVLLGKAKYNKT